MKIKPIMPLVALAVTATSAFGQTVLTEDFSNYTSSESSEFKTEIAEGRLHRATIENWTQINKTGVFESKKDKGSLWLSGSTTTGENKATAKLTISVAGTYIVKFDSFTDPKATVDPKESGSSDATLTAVGDVFINGAGWLQSFKETADGVATERSFRVALKNGEYEFGFQNNGEDKNSSSILIDNVNISAVPEPSSSALLGLGALGMLIRRKR